jgi:UDP-N-acetylmuramoylalanine--D-glutamate ligase
MKFDIVILGSGESGMGAAHLAASLKQRAFLSDKGSIAESKKAELKELGILFEEGRHSVTVLEAPILVKSPGIPDEAEIIQLAIADGIEVISEIEYAYRYLSNDAKIIAITGTNGKTTTSLLTYHLLKSAGLDVALAGNVGYSFAKRVAERPYDYYVLEVSSFQLDNIKHFKPTIAVLLNITPDHLDRYGHKFENYVASKFRITENLSKEETFIYCSECMPEDNSVAKRKIEACLFAISATTKTTQGAYLDNEHLIFNFKIKDTGKHAQVPLADIKLIGKHNMINTMAAVLSSLSFEVPLERIVKGLRTFENAPHRLEKVGEIDGVTYINDSKATNIDAVYFALDGINEPIIWVVGGVDKGNDYSSIDSLVSKKVRGIICLGTDNKKLKNHYQNKVDLFVETQSIEAVISQAQEWGQPGDVVLLSPACASFDLFKNYEDRGDQFRKAVQQFSTSKTTNV